MKATNKKVGVLAIVGVLAVTAVSYAGWIALRNEEADTLTLYGNVDIREVEVGFRVSGRLLEMDFDEGDAVTAKQR
ncbi:MAG: secretion protein HlyD, partial [Gammaproteobacteria bacterium]